MLVKVHYVSSVLEIPQQMMEKGYHEIYCWLFPFNFHSIVTQDSEYLHDIIYKYSVS